MPRRVAATRRLSAARLPLEVVLLKEPRPLGPDEQARRGHERRVKKRHERRQLRHLRAAAEKRRPIDLVVRVFEVDLERGFLKTNKKSRLSQ